MNQKRKRVQVWLTGKDVDRYNTIKDKANTEHDAKILRSLIREKSND